MSSSNQPAAAPSIFPAVEHAVDQALNQVGPYLDALLERAAPTPAMLRALGVELEKAQRDPRSVSHPELVDPDVFWARSAWPQAAAAVKGARGALLSIADELAAVVRGSEQVLEAWLTSTVGAEARGGAGAERDGGAQASRDAVIDAVVGHCERLHRLVDRLSALAPSADRLDGVSAVVDSARRQRAERDAQAQRDAEAATVDPARRAAFERAWSEGYAQDVAVRDHELRKVVPFRHQDLLLSAHRQAVAAVARDVEEMVQELTEPILGIGERMVRRYDERTTETWTGFAPVTVDDGTRG